VRLTAIRDLLRDGPNCRVRVATSRTRNGLVRATVTTDEPCESGNRLMPDLGTPIRGQNLGEIGYNVADANLLIAAPLAGEAVQRTLADRRNGIAQSTAKNARREIVRVVIQKEQAASTHRRIRMAECSRLYGDDRNLLPDTCSSFLRERGPSVDEIIRELEVRSRHCIQSDLIGA
jgi:hypothetical protein